MADFTNYLSLRPNAAINCNDFAKKNMQVRYEFLKNFHNFVNIDKHFSFSHSNIAKSV